MKKILYNIKTKEKRAIDTIPECGDYCDRCGDCLHCYGGDYCWDGSESLESHLWVEYINPNTDDMTEWDAAADTEAHESEGI